PWLIVFDKTTSIQDCDTIVVKDRVEFMRDGKDCPVLEPCAHNLVDQRCGCLIQTASRLASGYIARLRGNDCTCWLLHQAIVPDFRLSEALLAQAPLAGPVLGTGICRQ